MSSTAQDIKARKRALRQEAIARRAQAHREHPNASKDLCDNFFAHIPLPSSCSVSSYLPRDTEIDPAGIEQELLRRACDLCLPVIAGKGQRMIFRRYRPGDALTANKYDIGEPLINAPEIHPEILLVPLLGFDRKGNRLGYGGGYYDRTLSLLRRDKDVLAIGLAYSAQEFSEIPRGHYDARIDWIITETIALRCK